MSSEPVSPCQITFTPEFKRNLRQLAKKYRHIKSDLQPILDQLASGNHPGDQVPRVPYIVNAEGIVFLRGFRSHARQSVGESQEHPRSGERGYVWLRLRRSTK